MAKSNLVLPFVCRLLKETQGRPSSQRVQLSQLCDLCTTASGQMAAWPKDRVQEGVSPVTHRSQASSLLHRPLAAITSALSWTGLGNVGRKTSSSAQCLGGIYAESGH